MYCWHRYGQPPGLQRAAHAHLTPWATEWELIHFGLLMPQAKDADLSIRDTSAEAGLWVRLILTIPVTPGRRTFSNFQDAFNYFTKTKKTLEKLFYEIYDFFLIREENLNYKYLENHSPFTKEQNDEILNVLIAFSNILPHKTLFINNDYVYVKNELIKQNYSINVPHIHNYKSLASFIEETVKKENDYYDYFEGNNNFLNQRSQVCPRAI